MSENNPPQIRKSPYASLYSSNNPTLNEIPSQVPIKDFNQEAYYPKPKDPNQISPSSHPNQPIQTASYTTPTITPEQIKDQPVKIFAFANPISLPAHPSTTQSPPPITPTIKSVYNPDPSSLNKMDESKLKARYVRIAGINPDILPSNIKFKTTLISYMKGFSIIGMFLAFTMRSNNLMSSNSNKSQLWRNSIKFIGGYLLITLSFSLLSEYYYLKAFDISYRGMPFAQIEQDLDRIKANTPQLRY